MYSSTSLVTVTGRQQQVIHITFTFHCTQVGPDLLPFVISFPALYHIHTSIYRFTIRRRGSLAAIVSTLLSGVQFRRPLWLITALVGWLNKTYLVLFTCRSLIGP